MLDRLFPLSATLPRAARSALAAAMLALAAIMLLTVAHRLAGAGGDGLAAPIRDWGASVVYVIVALVVAGRVLHVAQDRGPWLAIAIGLTLYGAGNVLWSLWLQAVPDLTTPSIADGLWLSLYPASYVGFVWLARRSLRRIPAGMWLDGLIAGLGIAAVGAALVFYPILKSASGSPAAVATNLAYPVGDLILAALVVGTMSMRGWRVERSWLLLGGGFLALTVADSVYLLKVAGGSTVSSETANLFYLGGVVLLACAAWQPRALQAIPRTESLTVFVVPGASMVSAMAILAYDHFTPTNRVFGGGFVLAMLTIVVGLARAILVFRDLRSLAESRRLAHTDELTGLPNRRAFQERLEAAIAGARDADEPMALLVIDLDGFKELNDTLGHHAGDEILRSVGVRLSDAVRRGDTLARLGGDEFAVVLEMPVDEGMAATAATRLRDALAEPFEIEDLRLRVDASIGIALFPDHALSPVDLLRRADIAMYEAKVLRSGSAVYAEVRDTHSRERLALGADLTRALANREIEVYFQPIADARSGAISGLEALARWRHPVHGLLLPNDFIALAEQTGHARPLTQLVLELALEQCAAWHAEGLAVHVAVNITVADLMDDELPVRVAGALQRHGLPPSALVIELTERAVLADPVRIGDVLNRLALLGVCLSLDDFGTGFSSLAHLKTLPVSELKIDRSFVAQAASDPTSAAIIDATIGLAKTVGKRVVVEGVEDRRTWEHMAAAGADLVQGYLLSQPLPAAKLAALLAERAVRLEHVAVPQAATLEVVA